MSPVGPSRTGFGWRLLNWLAAGSVGQAPRHLEGGLVAGVVTLASVGLAALYWYFAGFGYFSPESFVTIYIGATLALIFLYYRGSSRAPKNQPSRADIVLALLAIAATVEYTVQYEPRFIERFSEPNQLDLAAGAVMIVLALEAARRVIGSFLPALSLALVIYALAGPALPQALSYPGIEWADMVGYLYSPEGIYGSIARVFASFVFLFIILGTMLEQSGGRMLFIDLPLTLIGWVRGGAAKVAIVASALFGMISGAATANVVSTGTLTIPLMKRSGFQPHVAAAFEASASTVGIIMPPLMGAAIFIMADITGIPYFEIVKASVAPALIFVVGLLFIADAYARKHDVKGIDRSELGNPWEILRNHWAFIAPIAVVVGLLVAGYSPDWAVFMAIPSVIVASLVSPRTRLPFRRWIEILELGVKRSLTVGGIAGCLGVIVGLVVKTGIAAQLSHLVIDYSMGYLLVAVLLTAVGTFFLGMGVSSVTADYILLSVLIAPALTQLGAPMMAAHLLIIWYTQTSNLTPPVCTVSFAAAAIADAHPWKTGFLALRFGLFVYLLPLGFLYTGLLDYQNAPVFVQSVVTTTLAAFAFSGVVVGYLFGPLSALQRVLLMLSALSLFDPRFITDLLGAALLALVVGYQRWRRMRVGRGASSSPARPG
ncbi:MAG: TRAP transporter fused permease subunit [Betaproteobacteria bacterium]|nr:TRAP transporter fused permease subunit [Betaproteobacteria bacterium]